MRLPSKILEKRWSSASLLGGRGEPSLLPSWAHIRGFPERIFQRPPHSRPVQDEETSEVSVAEREPRSGLRAILGGRREGQTHRCSFSANPSTPRKPTHTAQRSLKPEEMAKMKMPRRRKIQELCTWTGSTGNKGECWKLQVWKKKKKKSWMKSRAPTPLCGSCTVCSENLSILYILFCPFLPVGDN